MRRYIPKCPFFGPISTKVPLGHFDLPKCLFPHSKKNGGKKTGEDDFGFGYLDGKEWEQVLSLLALLVQQYRC